MNTSMIEPSAANLLRFTRAHLRHHEALMRATGGHFNLFQILGIGHYEVRTHSPILAELLNPQGRHGQGAVFLNLFLTKIRVGDVPFNASNTRVETERYIGPKTETTGGQIDIVVEDGIRRRILIENKIYAGDQENQLLRYHNYDQNADLIYLTLLGGDASAYSVGGLDRESYRTISYEKEIRDWLMDCRKEAACLPSVREMLSQYIALIEELTHQSTTKEMNEELIQHIIETPDNLQAFFMLRDAGWAVQTSLIAKLDEDLARIAGELGLEKNDPAKDLHTKDSLFSFATPILERNNLRIGFTFGAGNFGALDFGFVKIKLDEPSPVEDDLQIAFAERFAWKKTPWWPAYAYYEQPYRNWGHEAFEGVRSGQFAESVKKRLITLLEIANIVCGTPMQIISNTEAS